MKVKVISCPWLKVMYIQKIKSDFLKNYCASLNQILYESFQVQGIENLMTRCLVTWPRWQPCPYMVKTLQQFLYQNGCADFHKTWYVAAGPLLIKVCSNDDLGVTLTFFTSCSNLVISVFLEENWKIVEISEFNAASGLKICRCRQLIQ